MRHNNIRFHTPGTVRSWTVPAGGLQRTESNGTSATSAPKPRPPLQRPRLTQQLTDVVATVGDEEITFSLLNTMLNSSAMVGLSIPALGTPERNQTIITLLDKAITANLLYLDALKQGVDQQPVYQQDIRHFEDAVLASLYRSNVLYGDIEVSEEEIQDYFKRTAEEGEELTDDARFAIVPACAMPS